MELFLGPSCKRCNKKVEWYKRICDNCIEDEKREKLIRLEERNKQKVYI